MIRSLPLVALLLAAGAHAQAAPGGVRLGNGRLHPSFEVNSRFDDAVAATIVGSAPGALASDLVLHLKPAVRLDLPSPKISLTAGAHADYNWFMGVSSLATRELSFLAAAADLIIAINRGGAFSYEVSERFSRSDRTTNVALGSGILSTYNEVTPFKISVRPGGGAITIEGSYTFVLENYENRTLGCTDPNTPEFSDPNSPNFKDLPECATLDKTLQVASYQTHRIRTEGRWRFFPKTGALIEASIDFRRYPDRLAGAPENVPSTPLRVMAGLAGLLTPKLTLVLKAGYGDTLIANGYRSLIAHAEMDFSPSETVAFKLGYARNFDAIATPLAYFGSDRVFGNLAMLVGGRLGIRLGGALDFLSYGGGSGRLDTNSELSVAMDYEILAWLRAGLGYTFTHHDVARTGETLDWSYSRNEAGVRVIAEY